MSKIPDLSTGSLVIKWALKQGIVSRHSNFEALQEDMEIANYIAECVREKNAQKANEDDEKYVKQLEKLKTENARLLRTIAWIENDCDAILECNENYSVFQFANDIIAIIEERKRKTKLGAKKPAIGSQNDY